MSLIPQCVFDDYDVYATAMIEELGITCTLVYPVKPVTTTTTLPAFKNKNTLLDAVDINGFKLGDNSYETEETTSNIKLRVYLSQKDWKKISSVQLPDGSAMCIGYLSDRPAIYKCDHILIQGTIYYKAAEPIVHGLTQKYLMSFWKRNAS